MPAGTAGRPDKALGGDRQAQFLMLNYFFAQQSRSSRSHRRSRWHRVCSGRSNAALTLGLQQESALIRHCGQGRKDPGRERRKLEFHGNILSSVEERVDACACSAPGRAIEHRERSRCEGHFELKNSGMRRGVEATCGDWRTLPKACLTIWHRASLRSCTGSRAAVKSTGYCVRHRNRSATLH